MRGFFTAFSVELLGRHFWLPAYVALALGLFLPGDYRGVSWGVPLFLGGILYFSGLRIRLDELGAALRDRTRLKQVGWMTAVKLLLIPLCVGALTWAIAPTWLPGVMLVCAMPAGLSSVAIADLLGGDRVLALLLVTVSSLAAPLTVPLLQALIEPGAAGAAAQVMVARAGFIAAMLFTPFALAQLTRATVPSLVARGDGWWNRAAIACSCILVFFSTAAHRDAWAGWNVSALAWPLVLTVIATALTVAVCWRMSGRLAWAQRAAFLATAVFMNNGLGIAVAARAHPGDAHVLLPAILMQVPIVAVVAIVAARRARAAEEKYKRKNLR